MNYLHTPLVLASNYRGYGEALGNILVLAVGVLCHFVALLRIIVWKADWSRTARMTFLVSTFLGLGLTVLTHEGVFTINERILFLLMGTIVLQGILRGVSLAKSATLGQLEHPTMSPSVPPGSIDWAMIVPGIVIALILLLMHKELTTTFWGHPVRGEDFEGQYADRALHPLLPRGTALLLRVGLVSLQWPLYGWLLGRYFRIVRDGGVSTIVIFLLVVHLFFIGATLMFY